MQAASAALNQVTGRFTGATGGAQQGSDQTTKTNEQPQSGAQQEAPETSKGSENAPAQSNEGNSGALGQATGQLQGATNTLQGGVQQAGDHATKANEQVQGGVQEGVNTSIEGVTSAGGQTAEAANQATGGLNTAASGVTGQAGDAYKNSVAFAQKQGQNVASQLSAAGTTATGYVASTLATATNPADYPNPSLVHGYLAKGVGQAEKYLNMENGELHMQAGQAEINAVNMKKGVQGTTDQATGNVQKAGAAVTGNKV